MVGNGTEYVKNMVLFVRRLYGKCVRNMVFSSYLSCFSLFSFASG